MYTSLELFPEYSEWLATPYLDHGRNPLGWDCWGLVFHISRTALRRMVPSYRDVYESAEDGQGVSKAIWTHSPLWKRVTEQTHEMGDVIVFNLGGMPVHCGLVVAPGKMLHCLEGRGTALESYDTAAWRDRIEGVYRWTS